MSYNTHKNSLALKSFSSSNFTVIILNVHCSFNKSNLTPKVRTMRSLPRRRASCANQSSIGCVRRTTSAAKPPAEGHALAIVAEDSGPGIGIGSVPEVWFGSGGSRSSRDRERPLMVWASCSFGHTKSQCRRNSRRIGFSGVGDGAGFRTVVTAQIKVKWTVLCTWFAKWAIKHSIPDLIFQGYLGTTYKTVAFIMLTHTFLDNDEHLVVLWYMIFLIAWTFPNLFSCRFLNFVLQCLF